MKRNIDHYDLDVVIVLGYWVENLVATRFCGISGIRATPNENE